MTPVVTRMNIYLTVNGLDFQLSRDDTSKKWKFAEKSVGLKPENIDKTIEAVLPVLEYVKLLDSAQTEVDVLNVIANNFKAA